MADGILTPQGVLSYPHLFKPRPVTEGGEPRYSCNLIFDQAAQKTKEYAALRKACYQASVDFWGEAKVRDPKFAAGIRSPFRPCTDRDGTMGYDVPGGVFIGPWSKNQPGVVDPGVIEITMPTDVYAGQLARARVNAFAYEVSGNRGVSFGLQNVQITRRHMPRLDGRKPATQSFDPIDEEEAKGTAIDDDIPFCCRHP